MFATIRSGHVPHLVGNDRKEREKRGLKAIVPALISQFVGVRDVVGENVTCAVRDFWYWYLRAPD